MIYIYKLNEENGDINPVKIDTWDNGRFEKSSAKMTRYKVLDEFNRGYYFTSETKEDK